MAESMPEGSGGDVAAVERLREAYERIRGELGKVVVGQERVVDELLIALFCRGHCILEGVPGLAKTLLIRTVAQTLELSFSRVQFTPDLMPSDITGTELIEEDKSSGKRSLRFVKGPLFANVVLADEVNRTPPKTQSALLEAMQEQQVTVGGVTHTLPSPFFVLATQNPIEQEGTYPLPEAQLDRFMFKILVDYPTEEEEREIVKLTTSGDSEAVQPHLGAEEILRLQEIVRRVPCSDHVIQYATTLTRMTRRGREGCPQFVEDFVAWGAGPRASQHLVVAGKARALLHGRYYVSTEDVREMALPVLRHRVITNFNAEADGIGRDDIIRMVLEAAPSGPADTIDDRLARRVFAENAQASDDES